MNGEMQLKNKNIRFSIFAKMSIAFIIIGLMPLLAITFFSLREFKGNVNNIIINNAEGTLDTYANYVNGMLDEWKADTEEMYTRVVEPGVWFADILTDAELDDEEKNRKIRMYLTAFDTSDGVKSVRFLDTKGNLYYVTGTVGKVVNTEQMEKWKRQELKKENNSHKLMIESVHEDTYFANMNDSVITVKRNLYDISSLESTNHCLGTLYLDISEDAVSQNINNLELAEHSGYYILDQSGNIIYKSDNQEDMTKTEAKTLISKMNQNQTIIEMGNHYYLCRSNTGGEWISILNVHKDDVVKIGQKMEKYIIFVLLGSSVFLLVIYFLFSKQFTKPIHVLKKGMQKIQEGDLSTRVELKSTDELGILADGLNQMADQLGIYINRVYGAEIKQRDAELKALKSQINPHYLYNTLDVIRMTALESQDKKTADMIESLARQLRYITHVEQDEVTLKEELDNISDYFMLIRIRYEERMTLHMSVPDELLQVQILKLILQPLVENAVKHGLRPKDGEGKVWITADVKDDILEITIMDNGVGISGERLLEIQDLLSGKRKKRADGEVGLVNIAERIKNKYGMTYGIKSESTENKGTIIIVTLPFQGEKTDEISYDFD